MLHVAKHGYCLQGLTETHFVGKYTIYIVLVQRDHPIQSADLVVSHFTGFDVARRLFKTEQRWRFSIGGICQQFVIFLFLGLTMSTTANNTEDKRIFSDLSTLLLTH